MPAVRSSQTFQDLNRRCLTRAVWTQQAEYFTFRHVKAHATERFDGAVTLVKLLDLDGGFTHGRDLIYNIFDHSWANS